VTAPAWPLEAITSALGEVRAWLRTAVAMLVRPRSFARAWGEGTAHAMNPLGFFAGALAVVTALGQLDRFGPQLPGRTDPSIAHDLGAAIGPYLHYLAIGILCHLFAHPRGGIRALSLSAGVALFAGGVATVLTAGVLQPLQLFWSIRSGRAAPTAMQPHLPVLIPILIAGFLLFCTALARGLAGAHRMSIARPALGLVAAWLISGAAISFLHLPGEYGFHITFNVGRDAAGHRTVGAGLTF